MKIKRKFCWFIFNLKWCIKCGKVTDMRPVWMYPRSELSVCECPECGSRFQKYRLALGDDVLVISDDAKLPPFPWDT